jgi:SAM-dependent methyltransferase
MYREKCAICEEDNSTEDIILSLDNVPIKLSCNDEPIKQNSEMIFFQCKYCKTIQLRKLIPLDILYVESNNLSFVGNTWKGYFDLFTEKIKNVVENKNILELGCSSGKIVNILDNYKKWYIVEPTKSKNIILNENIFLIETAFDDKFTINDDIDVIIHTHLFDCTYNPNEFLKQCYELLKDDGEMFFGIPNMGNFIQYDKPLLGVYFEHTIFLNKENTTYLLNKHNFEIVEIIDYENHSSLYHCKKHMKQQNFNTKLEITNYYDPFMESVQLLKSYITNCNNFIENTEKDVYIFGASYYCQFLLVLGLNINKIKGILDNSIEKQNKFLYGFELEIFEPSSILKNNNCVILLKNGHYVTEIINQILLINKNTEIIL